MQTWRKTSYVEYGLMSRCLKSEDSKHYKQRICDGGGERRYILSGTQDSRVLGTTPRSISNKWVMVLDRPDFDKQNFLSTMANQFLPDLSWDCTKPSSAGNESNEFRVVKPSRLWLLMTPWFV